MDEVDHRQQQHCSHRIVCSGQRQRQPEPDDAGTDQLPAGSRRRVTSAAACRSAAAAAARAKAQADQQQDREGCDGTEPVGEMDGHP